MSRTLPTVQGLLQAVKRHERILQYIAYRYSSVCIISTLHISSVYLGFLTAKSIPIKCGESSRVCKFGFDRIRKCQNYTKINSK